MVLKNSAREKKPEDYKALVDACVQKFGRGNTHLREVGVWDPNLSFLKVKASLEQLEAVAQKVQLNLPGRSDDMLPQPFTPVLKMKKYYAHPPHNTPCPHYDPVRQDRKPCHCNLFTSAQQQEMVRILLEEVLDSVAGHIRRSSVPEGAGLRYLRDDAKLVEDMFPLQRGGARNLEGTGISHRPSQVGAQAPASLEEMNELSMGELLKMHCGFWGSIKTSFHFSKYSEYFVNKMRDYFGEKIALYFYFLHYTNSMLLFLAGAGIITFAAEYLSGNRGWATLIFAAVVIVWGLLFVKMFNRRNSVLSFRWLMMDYEEDERTLDRFITRCERDSSSAKLRPGFYESHGIWVDLSRWMNKQQAPKNGRARKPGLQNFVPMNYRDSSGRWCGCLFNCLYRCFCRSATTRTQLGKEEAREDEVAAASEANARSWRKFLELISMNVMITLIGVVCVVTISLLVFRLILVKAFSFGGGILAGVANAMSIVILDKLYKEVAIKLTEWENHRTSTQFEDKLIQKLFIFQFINSYFSLAYIAFFKSGILSEPLLFGHSDRCYDANGKAVANCIDEMVSALLSIIISRMLIGNFTEFALPSVKSRISTWLRFRKARKELRAAEPTLTTAQIEARVQEMLVLQLDEGERQHLKPKYEFHPDVSGAFEDFGELIIGLGFILLFTSAFPLAPLLLLLGNILEHSLDGRKLLRQTQRPRYFGCKDIGWYVNALKLLVVSSVISNTGIVFFTSPIIDQLLPEPTVLRKLVVAGLFEHVILLLLLYFNSIISDIDNNVAEAMARNAEITRVLAEYDQYIAEEADREEEEKMAAIAASGDVSAARRLTSMKEQREAEAEEIAS